MNTGIQITAKYYLLQWILWFIQPKVQINKKIHNIRWGTNYISLEEGEYLVEVYFNYFFGKACLGELNLALNEGETVKLYYHTPLFIFSSAILRIEGIDGPSMKKQPIQKAVNPNSPPVIKKTPPPIKNKKVYFIHLDNKQLGPYDFDKLKLLAEVEKISSDTLIWTEGMKDWESIQNVPEVNKLLS